MHIANTAASALVRSGKSTIECASIAALAAKQEQLKTLQKKVNQLQFSLGYEE